MASYGADAVCRIASAAYPAAGIAAVSGLPRPKFLECALNVLNRSLTALLLCLTFSVTNAFGADLKVGFVNAARVLEEAPQAEQARKELEKEFAPRDSKLVAENEEVRKLEEQLTRDGAVMSDAEQRKLERDIVSRKRDLKRDQDEFREDLNIRRNEAFERLRRRVFEVIVKIAKDEKFDLILSEGVVFASERIDITDSVLSALKAEQKQNGK
jgi:outer membrane protein